MVVANQEISIAIRDIAAKDALVLRSILRIVDGHCGCRWRFVEDKPEIWAYGVGGDRLGNPHRGAHIRFSRRGAGPQPDDPEIESPIRIGKVRSAIGRSLGLSLRSVPSSPPTAVYNDVGRFAAALRDRLNGAGAARSTVIRIGDDVALIRTDLRLAQCEGSDWAALAAGLERFPAELWDSDVPMHWPSLPTRPLEPLCRAVGAAAGARGLLSWLTEAPAWRLQRRPDSLGDAETLLAHFLMRRAHGVGELARAAGVSEREAVDFLNFCALAGLLAPDPQHYRSTHAASSPPASGGGVVSRLSFLHSLRARLGLAAE